MPYVYRKLGSRILGFLSPFSISGYQLINCPSSCSIHNGLIIYLRDEFSYDIQFIQRDSELWDGLFVDIHGGNLNGKLTIGNIYRPPRNNNSNACVEKFLSELSPIISKLCKNNNNTVITGDMNLDLLKIDEREKFQAYFDIFVTNSFFPQIMYPTRISKVQSRRSAENTRNCHSRMSATWIDQMFCRLKDINSAEYSGIILSAMSDHFPYFSVLDMKKKDHKPEFVEIRNNDATSFALFQNEVASAMESQIFENDLLGDPNDNYTILEEIIFKAKAKTFATKNSTV